MDFRNAVLPDSFLVGANLNNAQLEGANLERAQMEGANLSNAQMDGRVLGFAQMEGANLSRSQMDGADLSGAQIERALLHFSQLTGTVQSMNELKSTNLSGSINDGGMLRFADMSDVVFDEVTDFRNAFLDGSVTMTPAFRAQMGEPCQWVEAVLEDNAFYGHWRGWVDAKSPASLFESWATIAPDAYRDVTPIPPPPGCTWKTEPMTQARPD